MNHLLRPALLALLASLLLPAAACTGGDDDAADAGPEAQRPDTIISEAPPSLTRERTARFVVTSDVEGATFGCTIDGAPAVCGATFEVPLTDGPHRLEVFAVGPTGLTDPTPAEHQWRIDATPPVAGIWESPAPIDNSLTPRFGFDVSGDGAATFECRVDEAAFAPCTSPHLTDELTEGQHRFAVRATDEAGNLQVDPTTFEWVVDLVPPDTTLDEGPDGVRNVRDATFAFSSPDAAAGATFQCHLDLAAWQPCTSPVTYSGLNDGPHSFEVMVVEPLGPFDTSPARRTWTIDTVAPVVGITGGPSGLTMSRVSQFTFSVTGDATTRACRVRTTDDAPVFTACSSSYTTATLADGAYTFEVRVGDAAGNSSTAQRGFTVDATVPAVAITGGPSGPTSSQSPTFTFTAGDATMVRCSIDLGLTFACSSPWQVTTTLAQGSHNFYVYGWDDASNVGFASRAFVVDTVAPGVYFSGGPGPTTVTGDNTPTFQFDTDLYVTAITCRIDQGSFVPCSSPYTTPVLSDAIHAITVRASDAAGNIGENQRAFHVDARPLALTFTAGPTGVTNDRTPVFNWSTVGAVNSTFCRYDAGDFGLCATAAAQMLSDGPHTFEVRITSDAGGSFNATRSFTVDTVAPGVVFTAGPSGTISTPEVTFTFDTSGEPAVTECRLYRQGQATGAYAPCASPHARTLTPPSTPFPYELEVRVRDAAGNQWSAYRGFTFAP